MNNPDDPEYNDDPYKFYFQIDTDWIQKYMDSLIKKLSESYETPLLPEGFKPISLPVSSWLSSTADDKKSLYLGNNYWNEGIWKIKYFIYNKLQKEYELHLQSHARHIVSQPRYYEGLFEILN